MTAMDTNEEKSALAVLLQLLTVIAIYLFFGGWIYANDIFTRFGISLSATEIPIHFFVVYAYDVFFRSFWGWMLIVGIATAWYLFARVRFVRWAECVIAVTLSLLPFPLIQSLAANCAERDAAYLRSGHTKTVRFVHKVSPPTAYPDDFIKKLTNPDGDLKLVLQTPTHAYVLEQGPADQGLLPRAHVYAIVLEDFTPIVTINDTKEEQ